MGLFPPCITSLIHLLPKITELIQLIFQKLAVLPPAKMEKIDEFVNEQLKLLKLERQAVLQREEEEIRQNGKTVNVEIINVSSPSYKGTLITFKSRNSNKSYPSFKEKENIKIENVEDDSKPMKGIIVKLRPNQYTVHTENQKLFKTNSQWRLVKISNHEQFDLMMNALNEIRTNDSPLRDILFGIQSRSCEGQITVPVFKNTSLDLSQNVSVVGALNEKELSVIHGPPGTGKTTTLVEIIYQCVSSHKKILVTAASNVAVDNLGERLVAEGIHVARIGHPTRVSEAMLPFSISVLAMKEKDNLEKKKTQGSLQKLTGDCLMKADVVLSTLIGCRSTGPIGNLPKNYFDVTFIEECGQALEMACWIAIHQSKKLILAGDHFQLPPTVISKKAEKKLSISLMERLGETLRFFPLETQYRMNRLLSDWSSINFYHGSLKADESVKDQKLLDLPGVSSDKITKSVLKLIDTSGLNMIEISNNSKSPSFANKEEAALAIKHVEKLIMKGVAPSSIAIITPYNYQVELLARNLKHPNIQISTVDAYQGKEKEVIILSMVRSNKKQDLGFLVDKRRINVAITRAKRQLVLICNTSTINKNQFLKDLIQYIEENGDVEICTSLDTTCLLLPTTTNMKSHPSS